MLTCVIIRRVAIVDYRGQTLLDTYVQPTMQVSDYRTSTTGIEAAHLEPSTCIQVPYSWRSSLTSFNLFRTANARRFTDVQNQVANLIKTKILVGHALWTDLSGKYIGDKILYSSSILHSVDFHSVVISSLHYI